MTDPSIALQVRQPEAANPLATIGALQSLKNAQVENALRSQQIDASRTQQADVQAQADQRNLDLKDQNTIQQLMQDPAVAKAIGAGDLSALNGKVQPKSVAGLTTQVLQQQQQIATKNKADLDLHTEQLGQIATGLAGLKLIARDRPEDLPGAYAQWRNTVIGAKIVGPETLPANVTSANDLDNIGGVTGAFLGMHEKVQADSAAAQKIALTGAQAAEATGRGAEAQSVAAKNAMLTPLEADKATTANAQAARTLAGTSPTGVTGEQQIVSAETARHNKVSEATAAAAEGVAAGHLKIARDTYDKTYGSGAFNQGLIGVQPHLIVPATSAYTKAGEEYATAVHASDEMNSLIGLARGGNKLAYAYAPTTGVLTINSANGSKRVNLNEINSYGGAGSDFDKLQQFFGKHLTGESIDSSILGNMVQVHSALLGNAKDLYARKVQVVNGAYGSKFQPVEFGGASGADLNTRLANAKEGEIIPLGNGHSVKKVAGGFEQQ